MALVALIVLYVKGARERWGSKIAFVAFALVLCYWSLLGFAHARAVARGSEAAARLASANGEIVARLAAMPRLANPFRWDCVFETDRAMYRFDVDIMGDNSTGNAVRYVKPEGELKQNWTRSRSKDRLGCSWVSRDFQWRNSKIPVALLRLSFIWPTCDTLSRADREAVLHLNCRLIARTNNKEDERNKRIE